MPLKDINRAPADYFHEWRRRAIPHACVIQDLDAVPLCISTLGTWEPEVLIEIKKSHIRPELWRPFRADWRNYVALQTLADKAGIPFYCLYHEKDKPIESDTLFHLFTFTEIVPEYHGRRMLITSADFAKRWPYPFGRREVAA